MGSKDSARCDSDGDLAASRDGQAADILYEITAETHRYIKSRTKNLTSLMNVDHSYRNDCWPVSGGDTSKVDAPSKHFEVYKERMIGSKSYESKGTTPFAKDYARIVHSPSFRRLQGKTQLIPTGENETFRTRLTHSIEVAEIATRIARRVNSIYGYFKNQKIDYDLVSCASLLHDIGHPPFGHSGEEVLNERMAKYGGFEGNAQSLRIATKLESRLGRGGNIAEVMSNPRGLNLTIGTLAAILKYDQESQCPVYKEGKIYVSKGYYPSEEGTVNGLKDKLGLRGENKLRTIECQIMDLADDIAYSAYDLEDTLEAGLITPFDMMSIDDGALGSIHSEVQTQVKKREPSESITVEDVLIGLAHVFGPLLEFDNLEVQPYELDKKPQHRHVFVARTFAESAQHAKNPLVRRQYLETVIEQNINSVSLDFNCEFPFLSVLKINKSRLVTIEALKAFNFHKVITSRRLQLQHHRSKKIVGGVFDALADDKQGLLLSEVQREQLATYHESQREGKRMRLIADVLSSLTDSEAIRLYDQLNSSRNGSLMSYIRC